MTPREQHGREARRQQGAGQGGALPTNSMQTGTRAHAGASVGARRPRPHSSARSGACGICPGSRGPSRRRVWAAAAARGSLGRVGETGGGGERVGRGASGAPGEEHAKARRMPGEAKRIPRRGPRRGACQGEVHAKARPPGKAHANGPATPQARSMPRAPSPGSPRGPMPGHRAP